MKDYTERNEIIVQWVIDTVRKNYSDDVSAVVTYGSYLNGTANPKSDVDFYFIPKTNKAYELCKTFIVDGVGFDLFPMHWADLDRIAMLYDSRCPMLLDVKVLYYGNYDDENKLNALQFKLKENLKNDEFMHKAALDKLDYASILYNQIAFENNLWKLRMLCGYLIEDLSVVIAFENKKYFAKGLKMMFSDLADMKKPADFVKLCDDIINSSTDKDLKQKARELLLCAMAFMDKGNKIQLQRSKTDQSIKRPKTVDYKGLVEAYQELSSTFNKVYVCCEKGDFRLAFLSVVAIQDVLTEECENRGAPHYDVISKFNSANLSAVATYTKKVEDDLVAFIEKGAKLCKYDDVELFVKDHTLTGKD